MIQLFVCQNCRDDVWCDSGLGMSQSRTPFQTSWPWSSCLCVFRTSAGLLLLLGPGQGWRWGWGGGRDDERGDTVPACCRQSVARQLGDYGATWYLQQHGQPQHSEHSCQVSGNILNTLVRSVTTFWIHLSGQSQHSEHLSGQSQHSKHSCQVTYNILNTLVRSVATFWTPVWSVTTLWTLLSGHSQHSEHSCHVTYNILNTCHVSHNTLNTFVKSEHPECFCQVSYNTLNNLVIDMTRCRVSHGIPKCSLWGLSQKWTLLPVSYILNTCWVRCNTWTLWLSQSQHSECFCQVSQYKPSTLVSQL